MTSVFAPASPWGAWRDSTGEGLPWPTSHHLPDHPESAEYHPGGGRGGLLGGLNPIPQHGKSFGHGDYSMPAALSIRTDANRKAPHSLRSAPGVLSNAPIDALLPADVGEVRN